mmetsp:Transcript_5631/g.11647  ORF Transcript_5631/g.11647 Transcript_5631/m.11647 type:complete len:457 (-) Transcript_5631:177-1547(-)|eukprot:CAMPEP_0168737304 /NCGR_PEP_ID=MMETSP0724-20121128/10326_1 /TAXON_ID=265536 /ORGANISM="Amphiprora sp., Strain CCMP467" /LENGTH=456 /DNA_ID=CAMNT_0008784567 /DNA_START=122 /DNA_END=1492 /DNA_ORIENTATION=+
MPKRRRLVEETEEHSEGRDGPCDEETRQEELPNEKENYVATSVPDAMNALHHTHLAFSRAYLKIKNRMDELGEAYEGNANDLGDEIVSLDKEIDYFWEFYVKFLQRKNELKTAWKKYKDISISEQQTPGEQQQPPTTSPERMLQVDVTSPSASSSRFLSPMNNPCPCGVPTPLSSKTKTPFLSPHGEEPTKACGQAPLNSPHDMYHRHQFSSPCTPRFASPVETPKATPSPHHSAIAADTPASINTPQELAAAQGITHMMNCQTPASCVEGDSKSSSSPSSPESSIVACNQKTLKCVPHKPPVPARFSGDMEKFANMELPEFRVLCNYTDASFANITLPKDMRFCVMCGHARPQSTGQKAKNKKKSNAGDAPVIPSQNKGLCTVCDVNVWVVVETGTEIKWCKGCKNFKHWAAFGWKGSGTKCASCRERLREMYARSKARAQQKVLKATQKAIAMD